MKLVKSRTVVPFLALACVMLFTLGAAARQTLTVFHYPRDYEVARIQQINEVFKAAHPDVEIETIVGWADKLDVSIVGGAPPDVIFTDPSMIPPMVMKDYLMPLEPFLEREDRIDLGSYIPATLELTRWMGRQIGIPFQVNPNGLAFHKDLFNEAGVAYPDENWTWDHFISEGRKLTKDTNGDGTIDQWGLNGLWRSLHIWIYQGGGQIWSPDWRESVMASPENVATMEFMWKLVNEYRVAPAVDDRAMFDNLKSAMVWEAQRFTNDPFYQTGKIGLTRHAIGPTGTHVGTNNGDFVTLYRHTDQPDLAWEYLVTAIKVIEERHVQGIEVGIPPQLDAISRKFSGGPYANIQPEIQMLGVLLGDGVPNLSNHPATNAFADFRNNVFMGKYIANTEPINIQAELQEMQRVTNSQLQEVLASGKKWWWD